MSNSEILHLFQGVLDRKKNFSLSFYSTKEVKLLGTSTIPRNSFKESNFTYTFLSKTLVFQDDSRIFQIYCPIPHAGHQKSFKSLFRIRSSIDKVYKSAFSFSVKSLPSINVIKQLCVRIPLCYIAKVTENLEDRISYLSDWKIRKFNFPFDLIKILIGVEL